jgi:hypothetical protein
MANRPEYNTIKVSAFIDHCLDANAHCESINKPKVPVCIWGKHGIGKTDLVKAIAKRRNAQFVYIAPAQFEEMGDLLGMPDKTEIDGTSKTVFRAPDWVPTTEGPGILLIDDVNRADDRILRGIMNLTQNYELTSWKLPKGWDIVLTANPEGGEYSVTEMDEAMLTRMRHIDMVSDPDAWIEWAKSSGVDKRGIEFMIAHPEALNGDSQGLPPRVWTQFFDSIKIVKDLKASDDLVTMLATSTLNQPMTILFMKFVKEDLTEIPDVDDILSDFPYFSEKISSLVDINKKDDVKRVDIINLLCSRMTDYLKNNHTVDKKLPDAKLKNFANFLKMPLIPQDLVLGILEECQRVQCNINDVDEADNTIVDLIISDPEILAKTLYEVK